MTMSATELSLLRFACPHCGQRITCEPAYAGRPMVCPTCQGGLQIPLGPVGEAPLRLQPRTPTAALEPLYPRPADEEFWTETEWNRRLAGEDREQVMGFFTIRAQMYYAALYAVLAFHAGLLLGWQAPVEIVGAPLTALGDPGVFKRITSGNPAFWMLAAAAIPPGFVIARHPHLMPFGLPYPKGRRRRWWMEDRPARELHWLEAWFDISLGVFVVELVVCLLGGFVCLLAQFAFKTVLTGW